MAIDKQRAERLMDEAEQFFDTLSSPLPASLKASLKSKLFGAAFGEIRRTICTSRPPVLRLIGEAGHGKSSLLNALMGRDEARTGDGRATTAECSARPVEFPGRRAGP